MNDLVSVIVVVAAIIGFIRGFTDKRPSFWRGFGEGLAGKGECHAETYVFFHDHHTGLGIGTRIKDD